jgi:23S rRNA (adenine2503-C2)-methyltransferase
MLELAEKPHLLQPDPAKLNRWLQERSQPPFRARQVKKWLFEKRVNGFQEMTDLPLKLRDELAAHFELWTTQVVRHQQASDGTEKLLLQLADGGRIECVLLRDGIRRSICISSQVGCAMGCVFCASGLDGVERNLTSGEILEQMLRLQHLLEPEERLSHIVMMGMGEPLANLNQVLEALDQASSTTGLGISARRITISTVGLPEAMDRLTRTAPRYHLAVSLHAPNDALRDQLVPINRRIGIQRVIAAADRYFDASGRRLTFEYVLLADVNDRPEHAQQLASLLRGRPALLNVIPYNPVPGLPYRTPFTSAVQRFREILEQAGLVIKFRQRKGDQIAAACGQLRRITPESNQPVA